MDKDPGLMPVGSPSALQEQGARPEGLRCCLLWDTVLPLLPKVTASTSMVPSTENRGPPAGSELI